MEFRLELQEIGNRYPLSAHLTTLVTSQASWRRLEARQSESILWYRQDKQPKIKVKSRGPKGGSDKDKGINVE